jgi:PBSX family phage terminase large subunit
MQFTQAKFKGQSFIIAGKTIGTLKRNVIKPMTQILETWGWSYEFNRSDNFILIGSNTYYLFGANTEASQDSLQGLTAAGALADEIALFPQSFTDQMIGRCSVAGSKIFVNCNPRGPYHYFKVEYIDKAEEKKIYYIHFDMDDNLSLANSVKERFRRMFSGVFFKRYILGLWVQAEGIIYDMFDEHKHKVKTEVREYTEYYISCDYGTQNPMVYLLWGKLKDKWYCVDEYYYDGRSKGKQKTDEEYYEDLVTFVNDRPIRSIVVDPSAASFIATVRKHNRYHVRKGNNDVDKGIRNVSTYLMQGIILFNDCCINTFTILHSC